MYVIEDKYVIQDIYVIGDTYLIKDTYEKEDTYALSLSFAKIFRENFKKLLCINERCQTLAPEDNLT